MKHKKIIYTFFSAFAGTALALLIFYLVFGLHFSTGAVKSPIQHAKASKNNYYNELPNFKYAVQKSLHSVVHVKTVLNNEYNESPFYDLFFGDKDMPFPIMGSGSGVIISKDGYVVTNYHVIRKSKRIEIVLNDKRSFYAKVIGIDPPTDLALLKIDADELPAINYGNSDYLEIGDWVLAVGNPFNLTSTVTAGIVSAKARNINILTHRSSVESFIQTDAAINPGNSGGALVNIRGDLIGINTAIASQTGSYSGYSFAIPVSIVKKVINDLKEYGIVQRAVLGVTIKEIDAKLAEKLALDKIEGVYISDVEENSAAKQAGILKEDIILKVGSATINNVAELQEQISKYSPGDKIKLTVKRKDKLHELLATLQNKKGKAYLQTELLDLMGADFKKLDEAKKERLNISNGVQIKNLREGKLKEAGIEKGFIITSINHKKVDEVNDIHAILNKSRGGVYIKGVYPNGETGYYAFGLK